MAKILFQCKQEVWQKVAPDKSYFQNARCYDQISEMQCLRGVHFSDHAVHTLSYGENIVKEKEFILVDQQSL